jgi:hypothetical protein
MDAEKMKEIAERAARYMRVRGYSFAEVKDGQVHARTEVMLGEQLYEFPVVLTIGEPAWTYEVERAGDWGDMFDVAPGGIVTPKLARRIVKGWWRETGGEEEYETWRDLMIERGPGEEPPTMEKVRAVVERLRAERRERVRLQAAWGDYFEVDYDAGASS